MFERFTDDARKATVMAQEVAREMHHPFIAPAHYMISLQSVGDATAQVLARYGDADTMRERIQVAMADHAETYQPTGHMPFTANAKKMLENSLRVAVEWEHNHIATHELAAALVRMPETWGVEWIPEEEREGLIAELRDLPVSVEYPTPPPDRAEVCPYCGVIASKDRLQAHIDKEHPDNFVEAQRVLDRIGVVYTVEVQGEERRLALHTRMMVFDSTGAFQRSEGDFT